MAYIITSKHFEIPQMCFTPLWALQNTLLNTLRLYHSNRTICSRDSAIRNKVLLHLKSVSQHNRKAQISIHYSFTIHFDHTKYTSLLFATLQFLACKHVIFHCRTSCKPFPIPKFTRSMSVLTSKSSLLRISNTNRSLLAYIKPVFLKRKPHTVTICTHHRLQQQLQAPKLLKGSKRLTKPLLPCSAFSLYILLYMIVMSAINGQYLYWKYQ